MTGEIKKEESKKEEKNTHDILISSSGSISIEKEDDGTFSLKSERILIDTEKKNIKLEKDAKVIANKLVYKQLGNKLEKSIRAENLIVLTGAGSSKECGGPSMADLWKITSEDTSIIDDWSKLLTSAGYKPEVGQENLEELLSNLQTINHAHKINPSSGEDFSEVIKKIEGKILVECQKVTIDEKASHVRFLTRVLKGRSISNPRLKVFTLNYDTAFEQAGDKIGAVVIDGFLFSSNKSFRSTEFDLDIVQRERSRIHYEENFYNKVFQLYKIHGSINWTSDKATNIILKDDKTIDPVLIYPNSSKFERSFEMPFFEMVSRLQGILRKENTTLFIIGYGFGDEHVNRIIEESIRNNLNLEVFIIKPTLTGKKITDHIESIKRGSMNIHLIGNTFEEFSTGLPEVRIGDLLHGNLNDENKYGEKPI